MANNDTIKILIVEDNPVVRNLVSHGLKRLARDLESTKTIDVIEISDGAAALDYMTQSPADIMVIDLYLPILNGFEVIKRIRENPQNKNTRILAMSASFTDAKVRSLGAGADMFIQKPVQLTELLNSLNKLIALE